MMSSDQRRHPGGQRAAFAFASERQKQRGRRVSWPVCVCVRDLCQVPYTLSHKSVCTFFGFSKRETASTSSDTSTFGLVIFHDLYTNGQMTGNRGTIHKSIEMTVFLMQYHTALLIMSANSTTANHQVLSSNYISNNKIKIP